MEVVLLAIIAIFLGLAVFELDQIRTQAPGSPIHSMLAKKTKTLLMPADQYDLPPVTPEHARRVMEAAGPRTVGYRNPQQRAAEYERSYVEKLRKEAKEKEAANAS